MKTTLQEKKYRIELKYRIDFGLAGRFFEIDDLIELKIYLQKELVNRISLKYWNHDVKVEPKWFVENISIKEISESHFEWLIIESTNESRWLMVDDKLEKNHYPYVSDGIVDPDQFNKPGILFIMKEVNRDGKKGDWDLREFLRKGGRAASWNNISIWAYGLLESRKKKDTISYDEVAQKLNEGSEVFRKRMLRQIAVMNLKKSPGGASTNNKSLKDYVKENQASLSKQFESLNQEVDLIICCGKPTGSLFRKYVLNESFEVWNETSNGIQYKQLDDGSVIIYYYHPAARKRQKDLYNTLIETVIEINKDGKLSV